MADPIVHLKPNMTSEELLEHAVISLDGTPFGQMPGSSPRRWHLIGMGFVGGLLDPFTDAEMLEKASMSKNVAGLPSLDGNIINVKVGCDALVQKYA